MQYYLNFTNMLNFGKRKIGSALTSSEISEVVNCEGMDLVTVRLHFVPGTTWTIKIQDSVDGVNWVTFRVGTEIVGQVTLAGTETGEDLTYTLSMQAAMSHLRVICDTVTVGSVDAWATFRG